MFFSNSNYVYDSETESYDYDKCCDLSDYAIFIFIRFPIRNVIVLFQTFII